jgi:phosphoglycolate phosphatase
VTSAYNRQYDPRRIAGLQRTLDRARCLLLDFDGPVCRLFSERPARGIALVLLGRLAERGMPVTDPELLGSSDPHAVLRAAPGRELAAELEALLVDEEELAARLSRKTPGAGTFIRTVADSGRLLAVTTNNAPVAVETYLKNHDLDGCFAGRIFGRDPEDPTLMKPDPDCLRRACEALDVRPQECLMIGDSRADALAARAAGVGFVGFARSADRVRRLLDVAPYRVVVGMGELVAAARALTP